MIIRSGQLLANDHLEGPASCKLSSGGASPLQMIIWRGSLLQMIIWRGLLLANDHLEGQPFTNDNLEGPASCKWSFGGTGFLQKISGREKPLAKEHREGPASCKWSSGGASLSNILLHPSNIFAKNTFSWTEHFFPFSPPLFSISDIPSVLGLVFITSYLGKESNNQNGNLRWHLP